MIDRLERLWNLDHDPADIMLKSLLRAVAGGLAAALLASLLMHFLAPAGRQYASPTNAEGDDFSEEEAEQLLRELSSLA